MESFQGRKIGAALLELCCLQADERANRNKQDLQFSTLMNQLLKEEKLFAIHEYQGIRRCSKFTTNGGRLFLHHLEEGDPPSDACVIDYEDVLQLVNPSSRWTFLELGSFGASLGYIIICLSPNTKAAENFMLLCSGEEGPCYVNTNFFHIHHPGKSYEYVGGGDYEFNNGQGGRALVDGLELGPEYERPYKAGTVRGFWGPGDNVASQFFINTRDAANVCSPAFGMVEEGLEILKQAILDNSLNISEVYVKDCGIILGHQLNPCH